MPRANTSIVSLQKMMDDFLTPVIVEMVPNIFTNVPEFSCEREMYDYITESLNGSAQFSGTGMTFVTTAYKPDRNSPTEDTIDCGMYASKTVPKEEYTESSKEVLRRMVWVLIELLIKCKLDSASQDPFDESSEDEEAEKGKRREVIDQFLSYVELAFKYQQREFIFVVLFLGPYARVVRFDRTGIIASEKIDYAKRGSELTEFLVRYARLGRTDRGHDPSASRILPTDSLWQQLQQHGADAAERNPEDHVQKLFNQTLDPEWPWWKLSVPDEKLNFKRWFAVGKPHFSASGVMGRGTRGYVAAPLSDDGKPDPNARFVYLKDAWRADDEGMEKEGSILKALNDAKVPYVPTLLYHGDLDQSTQSYDKWLDYHEGKSREDCPLKAHRHYRLVVAEVGKPLSEFENGLQLVCAVLSCIVAHEKACAAGYIHRDVSAGNILLYPDETGHWAGLLNDWELSKKCVDGKTEGGHPGRVGTWQFMSVHALVNPTRLMDIQDDLESFFHVLLYYAVRFLPHNLPDDLVGRFLYEYFDDYTDGAPGFTCGPFKYNAMKRGVIDITPITGYARGSDGGWEEQRLVFFVPQSAQPLGSTRAGHPINTLITELLKAFGAFYARDAVQMPKRGATADFESVKPPPAALAAIKKLRATKAARAAASGGKPVATKYASGPTVNSELAAKVETHAAMVDLILDRVFDLMWPEGDKGDDKRPCEGHAPAKENTAVAVGSIVQAGAKRGFEDGEELMSKRVRNY